MRTIRILVACAMALATRAFSQSTVPAPQATVDTAAARARIAAQLKLLTLGGAGGTLPAADSVGLGPRAIPAGTTIKGPVGVSNGALDVTGTIDGNAVAIGGDIVVHSGGVITGDAVAVNGRVRMEGGSVHGEIRSLSDFITDAATPTPPEPASAWRSLKIVAAWFAILLIIGIGVMIFAEQSLDGVVAALERGIGKSFLAGLVGQVVALPALLLLCVALAVTLIGILLIPFAIVVYVIAVLGLVTMGFLAVARLTGAAVVSGEGTTGPRGVTLRALLAGLAGFMLLWAAAAALVGLPTAATIVRGVAFAVTWVAATVGLGATLTSRAGTKRPGKGRGAGASGTADDMAWQTPTPVGGVSASRRGVSREV